MVVKDILATARAIAERSFARFSDYYADVSISCTSHVIVTCHFFNLRIILRKMDFEILGLTKQRRAVLLVIRESDEHLTANEVFERARRQLPGIAFATVYNSLRYLKNEGLIGEVRFGADCTRYDRTLKRHDHAICNDCGKLVDLELAIPDE